MVKLRWLKSYQGSKINSLFESSEKSAENFVSQGYAKYITTKSVPIKNKQINKSSIGNEGINNSKCISDVTVTNVTNVTNNKVKVTKDTKETIVTVNKHIHIQKYKDFFSKKGKKELICLLIFDSILSNKEIDKELNFNEGEAKTYVYRNKELFEVDHKEKKTNYYKLSIYGKNLVDELVKEYDKGVKRAEEVAAQVESFKKEKEAKEKVIENLSETLKDFIDDYIKQPLNNHILINFKKLNKHSIELADKLLDEPDEFLEMCNQILEDKFDREFNINFTNIPHRIKISQIGSEHINKLISTECLIRMDRDIIPVDVKITFECPACGNQIIIPQNPPEPIKSPFKCSCGKQGNFREVNHIKLDKKELLIEEFLEDTQQRFTKLEILKKSLTNFEFRKKLLPGTKVNIIAIVRERKKFIKGKKSTEGEFYLEANNIEFLEEIDIDFFNEENKKIFEEIAKEVNKNGSNKLVKSFAPYVYDMDDLKEAIINQAVVPKSTKGRRTINVLAIGKTAVGKTEIFMFAEKYIYRCLGASEGASSAGLTVGLVRDEFFGSGNWIAEPGLLPKANNSIAIIDEIDKLNEDVLQELHSAMSRCYVRKTKIKDATLPADTCIIAGCNPFSTNPYKTHNQENWNVRFNVPASFINRFDLIFDIKDEVNEERDRKISNEIYKKAEGIKLDEKKYYDPNVMKKYLLYVKQQHEPTISLKIDKKLEDFYIKCRAFNSRNKDIPITARLKETIITLSKCYAKLRLSKVVEEKDCDRAIELLLKSMKRNNINIF